MSPHHQFLQRHSLAAGIVLMFLVTWTIDLSVAGVLPFHVPMPLALSVGWGFVLVALLMTGLTLGRPAVLALCRRYLMWRVNWRWYGVALLLLPALQLIAVLLTARLSGPPLDFSRAMIGRVAPPGAPVALLVIPWLLFELLTNGEEMGWRGYVLPRLQARHNALVASLIVGALWGIWHLPKFLVAGAHSDRSLAWFVAAHLALAVLYTWLYNNTRGSLLLVSLFHACGNTAGMFLPVTLGVVGGVGDNLLVLLIWAAAAAVVLVVGPARLSRNEAKQVVEQIYPGESQLPGDQHPYGDRPTRRIVS